MASGFPFSKTDIEISHACVASAMAKQTQQSAQLYNRKYLCEEDEALEVLHSRLTGSFCELDLSFQACRVPTPFEDALQSNQ